MRRCAAAVAVLAAVAGCGGQSQEDQVRAAARAYDQAFVTGNGTALCAAMTASLRRELTTVAGSNTATPCANLLSFAAGTVRGASGVRPVVSAVSVSGSQATATIHTTAGTGVLPLAREDGRWRVAGSVRYLSRIWLRADYRLRASGRLNATAIANILARRARAIVGTPAEARALARDTVSLAVAEPVRRADLALVTGRAAARLAIYDWEADALTRAGRSVADQLQQAEPDALLISQGSGTEPPGTVGGMAPSDAAALAGAAPGRIVVAAMSPPRSGSSADRTPAARFYVLSDIPALSGADIANAYAGVDARGEPDIHLSFSPRGARAFQRVTGELAWRGAYFSRHGLVLNQHLAAVLGGKLVSVVYVDFRRYPRGIPAANGARIAGNYTSSEADQLAAEIAAPPLPATLELIASRTFTRHGG